MNIIALHYDSGRHKYNHLNLQILIFGLQIYIYTVCTRNLKLLWRLAEHFTIYQTNKLRNINNLPSETCTKLHLK